MRIFQTKKDILKGKIIEKKWKQSNQKYILALEMFLDRASNIQDEALKNSIINSMLACDKILTDMAEEYFIEIYKVAYKEGKRYKIKKRGYNKSKGSSDFVLFRGSRSPSRVGYGVPQFLLFGSLRI